MDHSEPQLPDGMQLCSVAFSLRNSLGVPITLETDMLHMDTLIRA